MIGRRARLLGAVVASSLLLAGPGLALAGEAGAAVASARQDETDEQGEGPSEAEGVEADEGETSPTTPTTLLPPRDDSIIVKPDSGGAPEDAGDRGGGLQVAVFMAVLVGIVAVGALGFRESRRARSRTH